MVASNKPQNGDVPKVEVKTPPPPPPRDENEPVLPTPPDGGWGWVVVFGCFMIHVLADGAAYSFGVIIAELFHYFPEAGRGALGWIPALMVGVTWLTGPLASALTNRYGCRSVTIAGGILASLGFVLSVFAPSYKYLYFSFGLVAGVGLGLVFLPAVVSVTYYFEKRRSFATGLAVCGAGIGTFLFAPLSKVLINYYGWKGTVLIEGALILNCCVCGALFRPLELPKEKLVPLADLGENKEDEVHIQLTESEPEKQKNGDIKAKNSHLDRFKRENNVSHSAHCIPQQVDDETKNIRRHLSDNRLDLVGQNSKPHTAVAGPMYRKDIFYSGSLYNIDVYKANPNNYTQSVSSIPHSDHTAEAAHQNNGCCSCMSCSKEMRDSWTGMMDLSIMKDPVYILFVIANFLTSIGFNVPYTFLPDMASQYGYSAEQGAYLISVIGIANTVGRVLFGWLADRSCVNRLFLYNGTLTLCGVATALCVFCDTYVLLIIYSAAFGLFIGVYVSITSVVLVDLFGLDKLTNAFGILLMFQGMGVIMGPPIAGWLYDTTGSYDISFWIMGIVIAISGLMLFPIPLIQRCQQQSPENSDHHTTRVNDRQLSTSEP